MCVQMCFCKETQILFVLCFMSGLNPISIERMRQSVMIVGCVQFLLVHDCSRNDVDYTMVKVESDLFEHRPVCQVRF